MGAIAYRDAAPADVDAIDALYREVFAETFGHLYDPADLAAFFARFPQTNKLRLQAVTTQRQTAGELTAKQPKFRF